jgi:hypothetical protein
LSLSNEKRKVDVVTAPGKCTLLEVFMRQPQETQGAVWTVKAHIICAFGKGGKTRTSTININVLRDRRMDS